MSCVAVTQTAWLRVLVNGCFIVLGWGWSFRDHFVVLKARWGLASASLRWCESLQSKHFLGFQVKQVAITHAQELFCGSLRMRMACRDIETGSSKCTALCSVCQVCTWKNGLNAIGRYLCSHCVWYFAFFYILGFFPCLIASVSLRLMVSFPLRWSFPSRFLKYQHSPCFLECSGPLLWLRLFPLANSVLSPLQWERGLRGCVQVESVPSDRALLRGALLCCTAPP